MAALSRLLSTVATVSAAGVYQRVTRVLVTIRSELITSAVTSDPDKLSGTLQRQFQELDFATQGARSLPVLGGVYLVGVAFTSETPRSLQHGLSGKVAWIVASPSAAARLFEVSQDATNNRITLQADANVTADLWLFPKPSVAGG